MYIVTGMHRSGTSFISQALHSLGADFGDPERLFPADVWNQSGYFENIDIININNKAILGEGAIIDYWLNAPEGAFPRVINSIRSQKWKYFLFPSISSIRRRAERYDTAIRALQVEYEGKFVKDPRFCLTLGAWAQRGAVEGLVFSFRSPWSVAGSVKRRERLPEVFGLRYWLYHIRGFVAQTPPETAVFLSDFDAFFDAERQTEEFSGVARYLDVSSGASAALALPETLNVKLKTQHAGPQSEPVQVAHAYEALLELHRGSGGTPIRFADYPEHRQAILGI